MFQIVLANTVTKLDASCARQVLIGASHCGKYAAYLAAKAQARAVVLHDAGIGKDGAGVAGLDLLEGLGVPAVSTAHFSARIGDAKDVARRGVASRVNASAARLGCRPGHAILACAELMQAAPARSYEVPSYGEARFVIAARPGEPAVWGLDSISLVRPEDAGHIMVGASHGGLLDGKISLSADALAVFCNDAGVGIEQAGIAQLARLDERGIVGVAIDANSACIGNAHSSYNDGLVSYVNERARAAGVSPGSRVRDAVEQIIQFAVHREVRA
jgi:hypothetical protein